MQVNLKHVLVGSVLSFCAGGALVYKYYRQTETITKEVTRNNVVTVTKEITRPDGTKESTTTSTDHTISREVVDARIVPTRPMYAFSLSATTSMHEFKPVYGLQVTKQFLGPVSLGIRGQTDGQLGVVIGIDF